MGYLKRPKLRPKSRLLLLSLLKRQFYDSQPPTNDQATIWARVMPFYFRDGDYLLRFLLLSNSCMNTFTENSVSKGDYIEIGWCAERGFRLKLGRIQLIPTDCTAALLILRLAKITWISMECYNGNEPYLPASVQKWVQAWVALKRKPTFAV
jgi:hypothetical protein